MQNNIVEFLISCGENGKNVALFHQERPVHITGCPDGILCPLSVMKDIFPDKQEECNFDHICEIGRAHV